MKKTRNYQGKDVDMLTACRTIAGSFAANITELSTIRTGWTAAYSSGLITRIDTTITDYLGLDARHDQREATAGVIALQVPAQRDLTFFKAQVDSDFKKELLRHDEILRTLGFTSYYKDVSKGNQESMVQLLYFFKTNMTDALKTEITGKGMSIELINRILTYAEAFMQANTTQEQTKDSSIELKAGAIEAFNETYDEMIAICKIAASYYRFEPLKKDLFTFTRVQANQGGSTSNRVPEPTPTPVQ
ncbi:MAG: hypothetical protein HOO86_07690 [Bacteroidales bacterium]|nr:hypothetical protein [Bacteroidales bacterium]